MAVKLIVDEPVKVRLFDSKNHGACTMIDTLGGSAFFKGQPKGLLDQKVYAGCEIELSSVPELRQVNSFTVK